MLAFGYCALNLRKTVARKPPDIVARKPPDIVARKPPSGQSRGSFRILRTKNKMKNVRKLSRENLIYLSHIPKTPQNRVLLFQILI